MDAMINENDLKLIYVLKIGYNYKREGQYQFIFSTDETNIDPEGWLWDIEPACDNADAPTEDYVDEVFNLTTKSFDLFCLHEAVDRPYMHGYNLIHCLAYEIEYEGEEDDNAFNQYEQMFNDDDDTPLLVFHYGMTLKAVTDKLYEKKIILKGNNFVESSSIKLT